MITGPTQVSSSTSGVTSSTQPTATGSNAERIENGKNLEWSNAKPWLESRLQLVLDTSGKTPDKERNQAYADIQTWIVAGPSGGRAEHHAEIKEFGTKFANSDISAKINYLSMQQGMIRAEADAAGKNSGTAGLEWVRNLSQSDRDAFFVAGATPDKYGRYQYRNADDFIGLMTQFEKDWKPLPSGSSGNPLTGDEQEAIARLEAIQASQRDQLARMKADYNNRFGTTRTITDTIELSGPATKAAAETLATDGANDPTLKALETLKQVSAQQRDWLESIQEEAAKKAEKAEPTDTALNLVGDASTKAGSRVSVSA
jgi:hypothetical protein